MYGVGKEARAVKSWRIILSLTINTNVASLNAQTSLAAALQATTEISSASFSGDELTIVAATPGSGNDITFSNTGFSQTPVSGSAATFNVTGVYGSTPAPVSEGLATVAAAAVSYNGQISLSSGSDIVFSGEGLSVTGLGSVGNATTTIDKIAIDTRENATVAIKSIDLALSEIDSIRGGLGAIQNRFESTIANLNNVSENLSAARSRIMDADIAMETSAMTKNSIPQQAGVSILAQANQAPQLGLSLLG